jgi:hypothetical protein
MVSKKYQIGGYLEFDQNGRGFKAKESTHGKVEYEFDGGDKVTELSNDQKQFVAEAVKIIIKERAKLRSRRVKHVRFNAMQGFVTYGLIVLSRPATPDARE